MWYPSWSDYATGDQSDAPHLHRNLWAAWMPMLGATGSTLFDVGPRSFHAAANNRTNATDWVTKQFSSAYFQEANATGRFIPPLSSSLLGQGEATISCWVWLVATPATTAAIYQDTATGLTGARFGLLWVNTGNIQFQMRDPYTQRSLSPLTASVTTDTYGRWSHWCATYSAAQATINLYRDGVSVRTAANSGDIIRSTSAYGIGIGGRISSAAAEASNDLYLADLRLWNRALSGEEVRELGSSPGAGFRRRSVLSRVAISLGGEAITGSGSATTGSATSSASGLQEVAGACVFSTDSSSVSAAGLHSIAGSATASTAGCSSSADGEVQVVGQCASSVGPAASSASGSVGLVGSASPSTQSAASSAAGLVAVSGAAVVATDSAASTATGGSGFVAQASIQLDQAASQCSALVSSVGSGAASTDCQSGSSGLVSDVGSCSVTTEDSIASASAFVGLIGAGAGTTDASGSASGGISVIAIGVATTDASASQAAGGVPIQGSGAVTLESAYSISAAVVIETDIVLDGSVEVTELAGGISVPSLQGRVRYDVLEGRKIWP